MRVIARFCLTGLPIYLRCTERGPIWAQNCFLVVKSGYISTLLIWALNGLTGLFSLLFLIYLVITPNYTCTDHYYIYEYSKYQIVILFHQALGYYLGLYVPIYSYTEICFLLVYVVSVYLSIQQSILFITIKPMIKMLASLIITYVIVIVAGMCACVAAVAFCIKCQQ